MSIVSYNGITLPYPLHSSFEMSTGYDESNTDWVYTNLNISVQCLINKAFFSIISTQLDPALGADIAQGIRYIRSKLLQPRKTLSVKVGGQDLVPSRQNKEAGGRTVDARNGPQPVSCTLTKLNDNTFLMTYTIKASYWENYGNAEDAVGGNNKAGNPVISCRWSETQEIDQKGFSRRIRDGLMVIRSDEVERKSIDNFRADFAVVGIPFGFVRKSAHYTVDKSGLGLQFHLEDEEVYLFPPFPAYTARGQYVETTTRMGANRYGEITVELEGSKTSDKARLLEVAYIIALTKLASIPPGQVQKLGDLELAVIPGQGLGVLVLRRQNAGQEPVPVVYEQGIATTQLYENSVRVTMRIMLGPPLAAGLFEVPDPIPITSPPAGSEPGVGQAPQMTAYGNPDVDFIIKTAAHFDPSLQQKLDQGTGQLNQGEVPGVE